jgi:hypothetical protein
MIVLLLTRFTQRVKPSSAILYTELLKKQAIRKRLGMHVLLTRLEERDGEGRIPSTLGKERGNMGRDSRPSKRWTK